MFYYFSCASSNDLLGWVFGLTLFLLGLLYLGLHFCAGSAYAQQMRERISG